MKYSFTTPSHRSLLPCLLVLHLTPYVCNRNYRARLCSPSLNPSCSKSPSLTRFLIVVLFVDLVLYSHLLRFSRNPGRPAYVKEQWRPIPAFTNALRDPFSPSSLFYGRSRPSASKSFNPSAKQTLGRSQRNSQYTCPMGSLELSMGLMMRGFGNNSF